MWSDTRTVFTCAEEYGDHVVRILLWRYYAELTPWHAQVSVDGQEYVTISDTCLSVQDAWKVIDVWIEQNVLDPEERETYSPE